MKTAGTAALFELFPDFRHSADLADAEYNGRPGRRADHVLQRSTKELLYRLRKQVPSFAQQCRVPSTAPARAWARAFSRNESREPSHDAASNCCRDAFRAWCAPSNCLPRATRDEDAALNLADELTGITAMVAEKFTNERTADGIQKAPVFLTVGGVSLGPGAGRHA